MTLDEAIKHCEKVAEENQAIVDSCDYYGENMAKCEECAKEHRQLATWLRELKAYKEQEPKTGHWIWCASSHKCSNCGGYVCFSHKKLLKYCPECGAKMQEVDK